MFKQIIVKKNGGVGSFKGVCSDSLCCVNGFDSHGFLRLIHTYHAALIHIYHVDPLQFSDSAVSFV
jgi:hypothetical protein